MKVLTFSKLSKRESLPGQKLANPSRFSFIHHSQYEKNQNVITFPPYYFLPILCRSFRVWCMVHCLSLLFLYLVNMQNLNEYIKAFENSHYAFFNTEIRRADKLTILELIEHAHATLPPQQASNLIQQIRTALQYFSA